MSNQVIRIILEEKVNRCCYLIKNDKYKVLIDPGAKHHFPILNKIIKSHCDIEDLDYIIFQSNDILNMTSLELFFENGFKGTVVSNEAAFPYLHDTYESKVVTIAELNYKLELSEELILEFINTPFLPFPECVVTYVQKDKVLFSGHLFSQDTNSIEEVESLYLAINRFHEMIMPSIEFVRHSLNKLKKLSIILIYPRLGKTIKKDEIDEVLLQTIKYDFYNTKQVVEKKNNKNVSYNYEAILNHMLRWLETRYHREEIIDVFNDSRIKLGLFPNLEIESTELTGYKLWNHFFDMIFNEKGILWLALLEPIVRKYNRMYNINIPVIYKSRFVKQEKEIKNLSETNTLLGEKVENLESKVIETTDKLLRCPITNLYNQRFMVEHLINNLDKFLEKDNTRALISMQIDNLLSINKKYGTLKGDETLKNLVYIVNRIKSEDSIVFKQNGPGLFIYKHEVLKENLKKFVIRLSNEIKESEVFVEPITVSISIVTVDELNQKYSLNERVNQFIELSLMRLERAKLKGKQQILDKENDQDMYMEGIILLVDEDETYQNLIIKIFKRINYDVMIAKDIYLAYDMLENHQIDCIISEINLSKLDGFQFKQRINSEKTYKNIPFIIASHHKNLDVIMRANLLDIDLVLQKPIIPEELIGHIKRIRDKRVRK